MANEEQLSILKQGVQIWNRWRHNNHTHIDLSGADLRGVDLRGVGGNEEIGEDPFGRIHLEGAYLNRANLSGSFLQGAVLFNADLSHADMSHANLDGVLAQGATFGETNLTHASLRTAEFDGTSLIGANLTEAFLIDTFLGETNLSKARLVGANLNSANLRKTNLIGSDLTRADFSGAQLSGAMFGGLSLTDAVGLEKIHHYGPSMIGLDTVRLSQGKIPEVFLRGCGLSDWEIEETKLYNPDLSDDEIDKILYRIHDLRANQALQISPLFISYSHADAKFVDKVETQLNAKGIRYWRDIHEMKAGRLEKQIDRAIRKNPTVLLVLSEHSLSSDWVEHEVRTARGLEKEMDRDVLCPIALDSSWVSSRWPKRVMEKIIEYNILDFSEWQDDVKFDGMFRKLIDGLELFYKG